MKDELVRAVRADYLELEKLIAGEAAYAVALVSDTWADSVYLALNTERSLLAQAAKYRKTGETVDEAFMAYLRWSPAEWAHGNSELADSKVRALSRTFTTKGACGDEVQSELYEVLVETFVLMDEEKMFSQRVARDEVTLFLSISDDNRATAVENYSAKLLNPGPVAERFLNRFHR